MAGGGAAEAGAFAAPDTVLDWRVRGRSTRGGEEYLLSQALVVIEEGQLCAGVRSFAPHGDAGAGRVADKIDHAGQLSGRGSIAQCPVLLQAASPQVGDIRCFRGG